MTAASSAAAASGSPQQQQLQQQQQLMQVHASSGEVRKRCLLGRTAGPSPLFAFAQAAQ